MFDGLTIYAASRTQHAAMWRRLRSEGWPIIATWIDEAEEGQTAVRSELAFRCVREAAEADVTVVFGETGVTLKGALIEMGAALAYGKPVCLVGECLSPTSLFNYAPGVWHSQTIEKATHVLDMLAANKRREAEVPDDYRLHPCLDDDGPDDTDKLGY